MIPRRDTPLCLAFMEFLEQLPPQDQVPEFLGCEDFLKESDHLISIRDLGEYLLELISGIIRDLSSSHEEKVAEGGKRVKEFLGTKGRAPSPPSHIHAFGHAG